MILVRWSSQVAHGVSFSFLSLWKHNIFQSLFLGPFYDQWERKKPETMEDVFSSNGKMGHQNNLL